jgi:hypothetical protein
VNRKQPELSSPPSRCTHCARIVLLSLINREDVKNSTIVCRCADMGSWQRQCCHRMAFSSWVFVISRVRHERRRRRAKPLPEHARSTKGLGHVLRPPQVCLPDTGATFSAQCCMYSSRGACRCVGGAAGGWRPDAFCYDSPRSWMILQDRLPTGPTARPKQS